MIDVRKIPDEELSNCNCCGKYNRPCGILKTLDERLTKDPIYEYTIYYSVGGMVIRLCKDCAKKFIKELTKQIGEQA